MKISVLMISVEESIFYVYSSITQRRRVDNEINCKKIYEKISAVMKFADDAWHYKEEMDS